MENETIVQAKNLTPQNFYKMIFFSIHVHLKLRENLKSKIAKYLKILLTMFSIIVFQIIITYANNIHCLILKTKSPAFNEKSYSIYFHTPNSCSILILHLLINSNNYIQYFNPIRNSLMSFHTHNSCFNLIMDSSIPSNFLYSYFNSTSRFINLFPNS